MGTKVAQTIVDSAETLLHDSTNQHWAEAELLGYLNEGQRDIVRIHPAEHTLTANVATVAGAQQSIKTTDANAVGISRIDHNTASKVACVPMDLAAQNGFNPSWRSAASAVDVDEYAVDTDDPRVWYCNPPNSGAGSVYMTYFSSPADIAIGDPITITDKWEPALLDYILFRALSKDSTTKDPIRAGTYLEAYNSKLGVTAQ